MTEKRNWTEEVIKQKQRIANSVYKKLAVNRLIETLPVKESFIFYIKSYVFLYKISAVFLYVDQRTQATKMFSFIYNKTITL